MARAGAQRCDVAVRAGEQATGPISRGLDAATEVMALIDRTLSAPMFRSVGRLGSFPTANQVLQKRAGYRELLRTFVLTELGAQLALDWDLDDAFAASQRNIATLYEYWAYLQLAKSVGRVCGADLSALTDGALERRDEHRLPPGQPQPTPVGGRCPRSQP